LVEIKLFVFIYLEFFPKKILVREEAV
jgi:hypothetical protein